MDGSVHEIHKPPTTTTSCYNYSKVLMLSSFTHYYFLLQLFKGANAVIFAASASQGWSLTGTNTPYYVDYLGCKKVAEVAVKNKVPRLVIISSAFVTRPYHPIALLLSTMFGRIMQHKRSGELAAVDACKGSATTYTIIRPGGLNNKQAQGLDWMKIGQGDAINGLISREDVAAVTIASLGNEKTKNTVFELVAYKEADLPKGVERKGDWSKLFQYLKTNDGAHDPSFYSDGGEEAAAAAAAKAKGTEL